MTHSMRLILCVICLVLVSCSELQAVFDGNTQTSQSLASRQKTTHKTSSAPTPITTKLGTYYVVQSGDTLAQIADRYRLDWEDIAQINGLYESDLVVGRRLFIPHKRNLRQFVVVSKVINEDKTPSQRSAKKIQFIWPIENPRVTSAFGTRGSRPHSGIDIGAQVGTAVMAVEDGIVLHAERLSSYGNLIVIKHAQNYFSAYAHNSKIFVKKGQQVKKGQKVSLVGMTGHTKGPHMHFEIHQKMEAVDPETVLPKIK